MKANSNQSVLRTLAKLGAGADVVSGGELKRALAAGIPPSKILFSGVGKTDDRAARGAGRGHSLHQRRVRARTRIAVEARGRGRQDRADFGARQSGRRCRRPTPRSPPASPRTSSAFPIARAREVYARAAKLPGIEVDRHRHAYRQPDHRSAPRWRPRSGSCPISCRRCAPTATPSSISISAAASASPITPTAKRRRCRRPMPRWSSG